MNKDRTREFERLRKEYLEAERISHNEKDCLLRVINTFGTIVAAHPYFSDEYSAMKDLFKNDEALPVDLIKEKITELREKIFSEEKKRRFDEDSTDQLDILKEVLLEACRTVKRITVALLDDFYPMAGELKARADSIQLKCDEKMEQDELAKASTALMTFIGDLRDQISEDFRLINTTFFILLEHVKDLEGSLTSEFGEHARIREFENFEGRINNEVGSIINSFDFHSTIDGIKSVVIEKIEKIKLLLSKRKEEEVKRAQRAQESIDKLKKRIIEAEKDALEMSKKAELFQTAAEKDGLTGLYNRKSFDMRLGEALNALEKGSEPFSLVMFDVNRFKWINDTFGHVAGDRILREVAQALKETFRKNDFIARYGGDEFAVIIEALTDEMAHERILRFREIFKKKRFFSHKDGDIKVTISTGVAIAVAGDRPDRLINRADMDMYKSKKKRR